MEIKRRMSTRFAWLLGAGALLLIALLVACSSTYSSSSDGLVVVGSQGSAVLESYSFSLASGHAQEISNTVNDTASETCVLPGNPSSIVLDKSGSFAYAILSANSVCPGSQTGIQVFQVNGSGEISATGSPIALTEASVGVCLSGSNGPPTPETVPVVPVDLATDSSGQFLFVANAATVDANNNAAPGAVSVFSISNGTLTEVPGSPFTVPVSCTVPANNLTALAVSPTVFPAPVNGVVNAVCAYTPPPTAEYLYVADSTQTGLLWEFAVNTSTGALGVPGVDTAIPSVPTGQVPSGVVVDPCNRFVYVSNQGTSNTISAFSICNGTTTQNAQCPSPIVLPQGDGSLFPITGSPFSNIGAANFPGKMVVDTYGNYLYVLNGTNNISPYKISLTTGSISPLNPAPIATGLGATSIALRSDDSWLFVSNFNAATMSQYAMTPSSGTLTPVTPIQTDNYPWGVAVK
jgi:6-phosphogluconolactonase (cycloisomerase 2 family)